MTIFISRDEPYLRALLESVIQLDAHVSVKVAQTDNGHRGRKCPLYTNDLGVGLGHVRYICKRDVVSDLLLQRDARAWLTAASREVRIDLELA